MSKKKRFLAFCINHIFGLAAVGFGAAGAVLVNVGETNTGTVCIVLSLIGIVIETTSDRGD